MRGFILSAAVLIGCQTTDKNANEPISSNLKVASVTEDVVAVSHISFTKQNFQDWFNHFYEHRSYSEIPQAVAYMSTSGFFTAYPAISSVFLSEVLRSQLHHFDSWVRYWGALSEEDWDVLIMALWYIDTDQSEKMLKTYFSQGTDRSKANIIAGVVPMDFKGDPFYDPDQVSLSWAQFSASGDIELVEKIIDQLEHYEPEVIDAKTAIAFVSLVTIASQMLDHQVVSALVKQASENHSSDKIQAILKTLLKVMKDGSEATENPHLTLETEPIIDFSIIR